MITQSRISKPSTAHLYNAALGTALCIKHSYSAVTSECSPLSIQWIAARRRVMTRIEISIMIADGVQIIKAIFAIGQSSDIPCIKIRPVLLREMVRSYITVRETTHDTMTILGAN